MSIDYGFGDRMAWLVELMLMPENHNKRMKKLQREALRMYPLSSKEMIRFWMSSKVGLMAGDRANEKEGIYATEKCGWCGSTAPLEKTREGAYPSCPDCKGV